MTLYACSLTLHDNVFYATREMGILYETEKYLHNWAISYAFFKGSYIPHPYRLKGDTAQKPDYLDPNREQNLLHLNHAGLYIFPAKPLSWSYQVNTFKAAQTTYYGKSKQFGDKGADRNYPINYGRAKELAVGSHYQTFLIAPDYLETPFPRWIRLGKWAAKVKVNLQAIPPAAIQRKSGKYVCDHPLNPLDLPLEQDLELYNRIVMPPVSLVSQAQLQGEYWELSGDEWNSLRQQLPNLPRTLSLPVGVSYGAKTFTSAS
ncbi:MAG: type I-D CRISPR-associated protein Cas5/Csc1 [Kamptonema sp. SIO1D9]|nr:type I-D CRISPR-associated protein Cas5/Csc1 [Kamptonema sp. SIO1D9]